MCVFVNTSALFVQSNRTVEILDSWARMITYDVFTIRRHSPAIASERCAYSDADYYAQSADHQTLSALAASFANDRALFACLKAATASLCFVS